MSDDNTATGLSAEDAALQAEYGDEFTKTQMPENSADQAEQPSDTAQEEESTVAVEETKTEETETSEAQSTEESVEEDHNPDATLEETEQLTKSQEDGVNIAKKWDDLSDDEKSVKITRLKKGNRTETLNAIAGELGIETDDLLTDHVSESTQSIDMDQLKSEMMQELRAEMGSHNVQAEHNRFVNEVTKWASHNKISTEDVAKLTAIDGDINKAFAKAKFDPETGDELSFVGKLRVALKSETAQGMLNESFALNKGKRIANAAIAKLPGSSPEGKATPELMELEGEEFLAESDRLSGARRW